ncbi:hypothetical protein KZH41_19290 [Pseudomonas sp. YeP6b]|uniref:hypothetical protein n=1 Tax=Pseudomonas sp. YeP6b TaxID=2861775 RepID=UPI0021DA29A9|nr:hypothetical protein [Pseudomonas sp. YeP6b]UXZ20665.1 hypothetical protein KZH41_19290 [Pseudomonas sp. YeP6b]
MSNSVGAEGYLHVEGFEKFDREAFDKKKIRAGMRKAGRLVTKKAQMNLALARGDAGYPRVRTGRLLKSITFKVSRSGFMVKVAPAKTSDMQAFYPAYLHYGVKQGSRVRGRPSLSRRARRARADLIAARRAGGWRINPRDNYITDALQDSSAGVQRILRTAFADGLR